MKHLYQIALWFLLALAAPVVGFAQLAQNHPGRIVSGDTKVCENADTVVIHAVHGPSADQSDDVEGISYRWKRNGDTLPNCNCDSLIVYMDSLALNSSDTFKRESRLCVSCDWLSDTGMYVISVVPLPAVEITGDSVICKGDSTTLKATPLDSCTYLWSDGARTDSIIVRSGGDFSVTVTDTNSSCKNTGTMRVTVNVPVDSAFTIDTCDNYTWADGNGQTYTVSGEYTYSHTDANGCTQVDTLHLTINHTTYGDTTAVACGSFDWYEHTGITQSCENLTHSFLNTAGCDSIVTLHLIVNTTEGTQVFDTICEGDMYPFFGQLLDSTGVYTDTLFSSKGCDSVVTLFLTVNPTHDSSITRKICQGDSVVFNGVTLKSSGVYVDTLQSSGNGCDSIVTLYLTVNPLPTAQIIPTAATICEGDSVTLTAVGGTTYIWSKDDMILDKTHTLIVKETGIYSVEVTDTNNCSAMANFTLTVNPLPNVIISGGSPFCQGSFGTLTASGAGTYVWSTKETTDSITVTDGGIYTVTGTDKNGCRNVATDTITVNPLPVVTITGESSICKDDYATLTATGASTYRWDDGNTSSTKTVNSNSATTLTYSVTGTDNNGCSNTANKTVTVNPTYNITVYDTICDGESYNFFGNNLTKDSVYTHTLFTSQGCDSVITLTLTVNYPQHNADTVTECESFTWANGTGATYNSSGTYMYTHIDVNGCIQVDTLHLTILYGTHNVETVTACECYTWHGMTYRTSGTYTYSYTNALGCPSVDTLKLTVNYGTHNVKTVTACESYIWNGTTYTSTGTYTYSYNNALDCPSVDTLHLTVNYGTHNVTDTTVCESFTWYGTIYTVSGTYTYPYTNASGCASVDTLKLTVNYGTHNVETVTACESYTWHGMTYTTSGTYTYFYTNSSDCPSVDTLKLTVNYGTHNVKTVTACESYTWNGTTYTSTGTYTYSYNNALDCPSVDTLHLTVNYGTHNVTDTTVCESFTWYGTTYTVSGTYTHPYTNASGCASMDTLKLTVNYGTHNVETVTACESYTWHGMTYTTSGSYTYSYTNSSDCPSVDTLKLTVNYGTHNVETVTACESYTWNDTTYTVSGTYTYSYENALGCPSVDTLHLTVNYGTHNVTDTTVCESFTWYGTTYTVSGTYTHPYTNASGCASVDTLKLTVNYGTHNVETVTACDVYAWKGMIYTISGSYTYSYTNALGCPSVDTLHLTIYPSFILQLSETICQSELPYHYLNGEIDTTFETGTPQSSEVDFVLSTVNGCDSVISLSLTVVPSSLQQLSIVAKTHADGTPYMLIYPQAGLLYQWYRDGDAISGATGQYYVPEDDLQTSTACYRVLVRPDILHCGIMTDCWVKTDASAAKVCILPNPNDGRFRLLLPADAVSVRIFNANGQLVLAQETTGEIELNISADLANGLYLVKVQRENGEINTEKLVINR